MDLIFKLLAIFIALLMIPPMYRVVVGPTLFDRVIAAGLIGTNGILLLCFLGFAYERIEMFIDLSIVYALLNFIGTIATGKFLERRREGSPQ